MALSSSLFLPTNRREMQQRGWSQADVIILSADAYVDHPSFGAAVIGRILEDEGLRVAIIPQPDWHGDLRDFSRLGRPRLWFAVAPGAMDSMVNKYTAARRLRSEDAYSPDGRHDLRPEYPTIVYTKAVKQLYPDVPVVLGGIEASLRRLTHYDYWQDCLRPSILIDSGADAIIYGMGEQPTIELAHRALEAIDSFHPDLAYDDEGNAMLTAKVLRQAIDGTDESGSGIAREALRQTVMAYDEERLVPEGIRESDIVLHSFEACLEEPMRHAENFHHIETQSNSENAQRLIQKARGRWLVVNPPFPPMTTEQLDHSFDLPYTRLPHPRYDGKRIPAYEMIRFSVCLHRGCFGGCAFCTISAHQGKRIMSRSKQSILKEVEAISQLPGFRGVLSDLGGPSANMYCMSGKRPDVCSRCHRPSCIHPNICKNLNGDHRPLLDIYRAVDALPYIKKSFIGSGVRYDLLLHDWQDETLNRAASDYTHDLIVHHVSGRLKVAPEHTSDRVLRLMRKPSFSLFYDFKRRFDSINRERGLRQQIIPYFISSHPGCRTEDMATLAIETKQLDFRLEQVQDFTPTPMTTATTMWATGYDPDTLEPVFVTRTPEEKQAQRMFFFWYKPEERQRIESELRKIGRTDLISKLFGIKPQIPTNVKTNKKAKYSDQTNNKNKRKHR